MGAPRSSRLGQHGTWMRRYFRSAKRRPPLWNIRPWIIEYLPAFRREFFEWSPAQHARRKSILERGLARIARRHVRLIRDAIARYGEGSAYMTGGNREHWPRALKDRILRLAQAETYYTQAARMHARLARSRRRAANN